MSVIDYMNLYISMLLADLESIKQRHNEIMASVDAPKEYMFDE